MTEKNWPRGGFKSGIGVSAALLKRNNIKIFSHFNEKLVNDWLIEKKLTQSSISDNLKSITDIPVFRDIL